MSKNEFVKLCAERVGLTQKDMRDVLNIIGDCIVENMKSENGVVPFAGVRFYAEYKEAHTARNPSSGETIQIEAKYRPKVKFSVSLKNLINE